MQKNDSRKCKKFLIVLITFLLCVQLPLCAHSGMVSGEKNLRVAKTKWFDIIYPLRSEESAAILYENADRLYEEVSGQYGLVPSFRMPVVITPAVDQFNAMWMAIPYNHITIYDTGFSGSMELAVFSETLLSTFRHELTHAVSYNMKNGFWRFMGNVFGDCIAPGMLFVTTGMAEGATVTSESAGGEGRLNDEYATHYVKQAKIEGKFPAYHDVSGSSDVSPSGDAYYFNGAFHQWLQQKYGMSAYAEFWYRVVNGKSITISGAFKKSFGVKLKKAWKQFEEDYEIPEVAANPIAAGEVLDFFEPQKNDFSLQNNAGSLYYSLSEGAGRLVWYDRYGGRVFMADKADMAERSVDTPKVRHIFDLKGISDVTISKDGRFIAASYSSENGAGAVARVKIYDVENGSFYSVKESGLKDAAVIKSGADWYLVAQKYFAQHYSISISKILLSEKGDDSKAEQRRIKGVVPVTEIKMEPEVNPYAFCAAADDNFAYLKKSGLNYSLCISSIDGSVISESAFPQGMVVRSLFYDKEESFLFSYAQKGTLPRAGSIDIETGELELSEKDFSGGVFEPVYWNEQLVYIGTFYRQNRILIMPQIEMTETAEVPEIAETVGIQAVSLSEEQSNLKSEDYSISIPSKRYNPIPYHLKGIFIPMSTYESGYSTSSSVSASSYVSNLKNMYLGATYITASPWTEGSADLITLTGGWNISSRTLGTALTVNKGTSTSLFRTKTEIKSEFDTAGWKQSGGNLTLSSSIKVGNVSAIAFSNTATVNLSRKENKFYDVVSVQFSTIRKGGPGRFENRGFLINASYLKSVGTSQSEGLAATAKLCIPHLLPFESKYGYTYNLPLTTQFKLLPSSTTYGYAFNAESNQKNNPGRAIFDIQIESPVFGMDIQKAIPGITALYVNDFYVTCGYAATGTAGTATENGFQAKYLDKYFKALADGSGYYLDSAYIKTGLELTPNVGLFATSGFKMNFYALCSYTLHAMKQLKPAERFVVSVGFDSSF